ncbi:MAG: three-Cys-motif partner protein TcmP [Phycisphaerae bacterium]|nr:three-Cys-motif partner protein TcmP [Phycisphaerae bacterium]
MSTNEADTSNPYAGREQTLVKHLILEAYLGRFAHIVGNKWKTITYVDCFSGPWNVQSDKLEDSSFSIALRQLRKAKSDLADHGKSLSLRCFFLEKDPDPYRRLREFVDGISDAEVATRNAALEESVQDICDFVKGGGASSFPFIFIDPTGWTGFSIDVIRPLLQLKPGETLINFMTGHISRFAETPDSSTRATFDRLFGSIDYRSRIGHLEGQDREDELAQCYMDAVQRAGGFEYVCSAIVLHPQKDRTHFHLIYATRHPKGVEVFKQAEKKAMSVMEEARAGAQRRHRIQKTRQNEFVFDSKSMRDDEYYQSLRHRYLAAAEGHVLETLVRAKRVLYDDVWGVLSRYPLVREHDLKKWIHEWRSEGRVQLEGLSASDRVPKRGKGHWLVHAREK